MNERFDTLAKHLGAQRDRRGTIKVAAGGALGLLGLGALADRAFARQCRSNSDCKKGQKCVDFVNDGTGTCRKKCRKDKNCKSGERCGGGVCR